MSYFTKIANIFDSCVDNTDKRLYNIKCNLYKVIVFCLLLPCLVAFCGLDDACFAETVACEEIEAAFLRFECVSGDMSEMRLSLSVEEGFAVCGLSISVCYDSERVSFGEIVPSESLREGGGVISHADRGGEIDIIVDFSKNYTEGELCELIFPVIGGDGGIFFEMKLSSAYRWDKGSLISLRGNQFGSILVALRDKGETSALSVLRLDTFSSGEKVDITVWMNAPNVCFAAGLEVYAVEIVSFESESFSLIGAHGGDAGGERRFSQTFSLPAIGGYFVIVKPVAYFKSGAVFGNDTVILIDNGELLRYPELLN